MHLMRNQPGGYSFASGIAPYSAGVVAAPGHAIVRAQFADWVPLARGFDRVDSHLRAVSRPRHSLCAMELRIPQPLTFQGFAAFNAQYRKILAEWGLLVDDENPIARTNVAPELDGPLEASLFAFSYTVPAPRAPWPTFVVAGAGDLRDQARLQPDAIVAPDDTSQTGLGRKAETVMGVMGERLSALGVTWSDVQVVNVYTVHPPDGYFRQAVLRQLGSAARRGVHWYSSRPPIAGLDYEMDLRTTWCEELLP